MNFINTIKKNTIILFLITAIVLYIVLKDDWSSIVKAMSTIDIKYVLLAVISLFISIALKGIVNYLIVNDKKKINVKEAIKHNLITQFFNGITKLSTGGKTIEIYILTENNIYI